MLKETILFLMQKIESDSWRNNWRIWFCKRRDQQTSAKVSCLQGLVPRIQTKNGYLDWKALHFRLSIRKKYSKTAEYIQSWRLIWPFPVMDCFVMKILSNIINDLKWQTPTQLFSFLNVRLIPSCSLAARGATPTGVKQGVLHWARDRVCVWGCVGAWDTSDQTGSKANSASAGEKQSKTKSPPHNQDYTGNTCK